MSFLPLIANPTVVNAQSFRFEVPQNQHLYPLGMSIQISTLTDKPARKEILFSAFGGKIARTIWEVRAINWVSNFALPDVPAGKNEFDVFASPQRIEVSFVASPTQIEAQSWDEVVSSATHITHSSQDY